MSHLNLSENFLSQYNLVILNLGRMLIAKKIVRSIYYSQLIVYNSINKYT